MAKATLKIKGKEYAYSFPYPENPTKHNLAVAMAIAKGKAEKVTKYTGMPKDYNLFMELLNSNSSFSVEMKAKSSFSKNFLP